MIAFNITVSTNLPEVSYLTKLDFVTMWSYAVICIIIGLVIFGFFNYTLHEDEGNQKDGKLLKTSMPVLYLIGLIIILYVY